MTGSPLVTKIVKLCPEYKRFQEIVEGIEPSTSSGMELALHTTRTPQVSTPRLSVTHQDK